MESGVYVIRNTVSGRVYVGSSKNLLRRFNHHRYTLSIGMHHSSKLQNSWLKHGEKAFSFEKLLVCSVKDLLMYEQIAIDYFEAVSKGYNILCKAGSREGSPHSEDTVSRMRDFQRAGRKKYEWQGRKLCLSEIAESAGVPRDLLSRRVLNAKWPIDMAVRTPVSERRVKYAGFEKALSIKEWAILYGAKESFFRLWVCVNKLSIEECVGKLKAITIHEFARVSGIEPTAFSARVRAGWGIGDAMAKEVRKPLTIENARDIRAMSETKSQKQIAEYYGVHRDTIGLILRNISFREQLP